MVISVKKPAWQRIYRQTLILCYKNFLIFCKAPVATISRSLLFPIIVTIIFCELKNLDVTYSSTDTSNFGIAASATPIRGLADAIISTSTPKLVLVQNGISNSTYNPILEGVHLQLATSNIKLISIGNPDDLFIHCKQSLQGISDCFGAVIFTLSNETNVDYAVAFDASVGDWSAGYGNYKTGNSLLQQRIFPLQWTINSLIGNFSHVAKPSTQAYTGYFGPNIIPQEVTEATNGPFWLSLVGIFVGPVFILILIGVVYHLSTFVATERESSLSELMIAQSVTTTPRILSTLISFFLLYFPGLLICSILITQLLFTKTSDILFLFLTLLAGASTVSTSHFIASFFGKAQLAGLYASTLTFALALVTLAASIGQSDHHAQTLGLSLVFPPATWANLVSDTATREYYLMPFKLSRNSTLMPSTDPPITIQKLDGYLYVIFFIVQIIVYTVGAYTVEKVLWGVVRDYDKIEASSNVALRCKSLSKTYQGKRPWYWPLMRKGSPVIAINNLDLEVKKGSVTFLLGPNGGGKTTTLKCVAGMTSMDKGSRLELNEAGVVFGVCPQSNVFWENLTVTEHIKIWRKLKTAAFGNVSGVDLDDDDVLAECDLSEKTDARAKTLSGGQMRKLQLAISFVGGSKVCCIDEASSGLDPLSRRNIWKIIQKGHTRRTILVTTHFLDEADVLADHIAIVYKGALVCEGANTSLKTQFGDGYVIRSALGDESMVWRTRHSAEATRTILELEALNNDNYNVNFPTLEQVFLKVTSDTAVHEQGGDGIVGEEVPNVGHEKISSLDEDQSPSPKSAFESTNKIRSGKIQPVKDIDLDVGNSIGLARQIYTLFCKRYSLLMQKSGWISYGISLIIPIIIASAMVKSMYRMDPMQTCAMNDIFLRNASFKAQPLSSTGQVLAPLTTYYPPQFNTYGSKPSAIVGPSYAFSNAEQEDIYTSNLGEYFFTNEYSSASGYSSKVNRTLALSTRLLVDDTSTILKIIANYSGYTPYQGFALWSPSPESSILFHSTQDYTYSAGISDVGFGLLTARISNSTPTTGIAKKITTSLRTMRHPENVVNFYYMPIVILIALAFIASASIAIIYPSFERNNRVRALHYCNGVSPFALWLGYLLFDMQLILIQSIFVWALIFAGSLTKLWYASNYLLGVFILFGIATYLGVYLLSLYTKKAAFAIAAGLHVLLFVLYIVSYVMVQSFGNKAALHETYSSIQYGLGLSSPAANLARGLFVASNTFEVLCGKYADADVSQPFAYVRYGSVYANLLIQIVFLTAALFIHEYGSADWFRRKITHRGTPNRLHYIIDSGNSASLAPIAGEAEDGNIKDAITKTVPANILSVSRISKFFGKLSAVENISFDIAPNQTLALLGGNGAGKTTVINMIRGELKPNFGDIYLDGVSVLKQPQKARLHMGVCPQDDAIDNLTVRQTLRFYATVKGLKNVQANVDKVLTALNIVTYQDLSVKALSGGTRRKLSVGIALLGNPRILLLDEPSTGQDAGAKRVLWKALQAISANRAILLTTHSMEEAEALATNVAIMGTKMLAKGTLTELQKIYGGAFAVRAQRCGNAGREAVEALVRGTERGFGDKVREYRDRNGQVEFLLPHEKRELGSIMRIMEGLNGDLVEEHSEEELKDGSARTSVEAGRANGRAASKWELGRVFSDYTVTGPTLEEVFMNVARESGSLGSV